MPTKHRKIKRKIVTGLLLIALFIGLGVFLFSGDNAEIVKNLFRGNLTREKLRESLAGFGVRGYITIGFLSMLQVALTFLPAEPVQVMAGIGMGILKGGLVCLAGVFLGNTLIYILYKIYGDRLKEYFHKNAEFDFDAASRSKKVALVVLILYFLPAIPYGLICFFCASLNTRYPKYILLTTLGSIPSILIGVGLGHMAIAASWILSVCVFLVLIVLLVLLFRHKTAVFKRVNEFMKKRNEPYSSKTTVKKSNRFLFRFLVFFVGSYFKLKLRMHMKNNAGRLQKPSIVLCTHGSFIDFVYLGLLCKKEYPAVITARMYFYHRRLGGLLRAVGTFPKSMFSADIENAKNCLRVLSDGGVLAMMPEARLSTVGRFEGIQESTYKFIQKQGVAVYALRTHGAYFAQPKWGDKIRRGSHVEAELSPLFAEGETKGLSLDEVKKRVDEALFYDEFEWLKTRPKLRYKSKTLAKGLENVLCRCPDCGGKYTFVTQGRTISCSACGFARTLDSRYAFTQPVPFENFAQWYDWQTSEREKEIRENPDFRLESEVTLLHSCKSGKSFLEEAGKGVCTLDKTGLRYRGTENGERTERFFPLADIYRLLFGAGEDFELYVGEEIYYFRPQEKRCCVEWYIVSGLLKKIYP